MKNTLLIIRLALSGILENKGRTFLTMLGIIIGVASVISIMSIGAGAQSLITNSIKQIGTNLIAVLPGNQNDNGPPASALGIFITTLTADDARKIAEIPNIVGISAFITGSADISHLSRSYTGTFRGNTWQYPMVENNTLLLGRFFTEQEDRTASKVVVLGYDAKEELFPFTNPLGKKVKIKNENFSVIGVLEKKGGSLGGTSDNQVFVPLNTAQKILLGVHYVAAIRVKVDREENISVVEERMERLLRYRHNIKADEENDFGIRSLGQALDTFTTITNALSFFLASIAAVSLIVGGIGISNVMLMTVKERTREIGLKKAIGAKPSQIQKQFLLEAMTLTGIGGIIGIILGIFFSFLVAFGAQYMEYKWDFVVSPLSIVSSVLVSLLIGIVFGMYPAKKAAQLNPIDALRYE
jgi:putative ABC transport system permease protein